MSLVCLVGCNKSFLKKFSNQHWFLKPEIIKTESHIFVKAFKDGNIFDENQFLNVLMVYGLWVNMCDFVICEWSGVMSKWVVDCKEVIALILEHPEAQEHFIIC